MNILNIYVYSIRIPELQATEADSDSWKKKGQMLGVNRS